MRLFKAISAALAGGILLSTVTGCATIAHGGGDQELAIRSTPSEATVYVDGEHRGMTPLDVNLQRKNEHVIIVTREGYIPSTTKLHKEISYLSSGGILLGAVGLIGTGIDLASGGAYILKPSKIEADLLRDNSSDNAIATN